MSRRPEPRVLTLPPGAPFLRTLVETLLDGRLLPGFRHDGDPLALASATIYVPTRRAARELRGVFVDHMGGRAAILPVIRPLGEFDEEDALFEAEDPAAVDPPIPGTERLLLLARLVRAWKRRLPAEVAQRFAEEMVVPASSADALWLAHDLGGLIDEVATHGADWNRLAGLVDRDFAGWWQVTLEFLRIVTEHWPAILAERGLSDPAAHRAAILRAEAARLGARGGDAPVIAAGSTGSIPATADLLATIARLPMGAVVLPGFDTGLDEPSWKAITAPAAEPAIFGHPQFGLARLIARLGIDRREVEPLAVVADDLTDRAAILGEAFRPADTTEIWPRTRSAFTRERVAAAFADVSLVEAASEREEALVVATALRLAIAEPGSTAALVTPDRLLARRVAGELRRFGIEADDSGGVPLATTAPAGLLRLMVRAAAEPGDPVSIVALLKHPLLRMGLPRDEVRRAAGLVELVTLRGGTGRPDVAALAALFERRWDQFAKATRRPFWHARVTPAWLDEARRLLGALDAALQPLVRLRAARAVPLPDAARLSVVALEALGRDDAGAVDGLYAGDAGTRLADLLRRLVGAAADYDIAPTEWPDVLEALLAREMVKPSQGSDPRISIWGTLEARLMAPDTLVIGGLNEGSWPQRAVADRFMSRLMKTGLDLEPPERRVGQAAHDFQMALGVRQLVLARAARSGDAPAVASRWLQRLIAYLGPDAAPLRARGAGLVAWAHRLDAPVEAEPAQRPAPTPPLDLRPTGFSVTEVETLRRDPYAIHARRILRLEPLDPLVRDPSAAERGTLFHAILHRFVAGFPDPRRPGALEALVAAGGEEFALADLPADVHAVWWPRFLRLAGNIVAWEVGRAASVQARHSEARAAALRVGASPITLSGYADRIDLQPSGLADILDYKTGSFPNIRQAHRLLSPQLALEAALLRRGAFADVGSREPADLLYVRLKPDGTVKPESILELRRSPASIRSAVDLAEDAWQRLEGLGNHYAVETNGYLSRALPLRETLEGPYDHLARVLEWSVGSDEDGGEE